MNCEIILIGTELLNFRVSDTNSIFLINELRKMGYSANLLTIVKDDEASLESVFNAAIRRSDIIITSGGLGSTHDDLTKRYIAKVLNHKLIFNNEALENITKKYEEKQIEMPKNIQKQALLPRRSILIKNKYGTAPGFICHENEKIIICLPGVPKEFEQMWLDEVKPYVIEKLGVLIEETTLLARICGLSEMEVNDLLTPFYQKEGLTWNLMVSEEGVDIEFFFNQKLLSSNDYDCDKLKKDLKELFGTRLYSWVRIGMEEVVGRLLIEQGLSIAVAESCTGGLISHRLTQVPGSSKYFDSGVVAYSNSSKEELLDVRTSTLKEHGAVSSHVALEMAMGIRKKTGAGIGLSTTGIAVPGGGSNEKPVGLIYSAISTQNECSSHSFRFMGDRQAVKMKASQAALNVLRLYLEGRQTK